MPLDPAPPPPGVILWAGECLLFGEKYSDTTVEENIRFCSNDLIDFNNFNFFENIEIIIYIKI